MIALFSALIAGGTAGYVAGHLVSRKSSNIGRAIEVFLIVGLVTAILVYALIERVFS